MAAIREEEGAISLPGEIFRDLAQLSSQSMLGKEERGREGGREGARERERERERIIDCTYQVWILNHSPYQWSLQ